MRLMVSPNDKDINRLVYKIYRIGWDGYGMVWYDVNVGDVLSNTLDGLPYTQM